MCFKYMGLLQLVVFAWLALVCVPVCVSVALAHYSNLVNLTEQFMLLWDVFKNRAD